MAFYWVAPVDDLGNQRRRNVPPFFAANCVRSGGGFFMFAANGPSPCADMP